MADRERLAATLRRLDGRGYRAYRDIEGTYDFGDFRLLVDHAQGDPFASPSHLRARFAEAVHGIPRKHWTSTVRRVACEDFLLRSLCRAAKRDGGRSAGTGKSGMVLFQQPGQEVLARNGIALTEEGLEVRFFVGLPAFGRRIAGREAITLLTETVPRILRGGGLAGSVDQGRLAAHVDGVEDQAALRGQLRQRGLVAFLADGSLLPRRSGVDDRPMDAAEAVPLEAPEALAVTLDTPNGGPVRGLGIPTGVTLLVGGGYHGKSTLLRAMERGVYDHVLGDGREKVVSLAAAAKVRAEDGRSISRVDISNFINNLPNGADTAAFSTPNASGSTSQAAGIVESLQAGSELLLLDEDTSATNFMIRDRWMRELIADAAEPITPFLDKVRGLLDARGVSTILVVGGAGDYFAVADRVLALERYRVRDATAEARGIAERMRVLEAGSKPEPFREIRTRRVVLDSLDPRKGRRQASVKERGGRVLLFGVDEIDLSLVEQIVDRDQIQAIGHAMVRMRRDLGGAVSIADVRAWLEDTLRIGGLEALSERPDGHPGVFMAQIRPLELIGAINRFRRLRCDVK